MGTIFQDSPAYAGNGQPPPGGESRMLGLFPGSPSYVPPGSAVAVVSAPVVSVPAAPGTPGAPGGGDVAPPVVQSAADDVVIVVRSRGFDCSLRVSSRAIGGFARGMASVLSSRALRLTEDCDCHKGSDAGGVSSDPSSARASGEEPSDGDGHDDDPDGGGAAGPRRWWRG